MNTMKSLFTIVLIICCTSTMFAKDIEPVAEDNPSKDLYVTITNSSDCDIFYLYVSPESSGDWEEDVLDEDVLLAGESIKINLYGYEECLFDIKAVYATDDEEIDMGVNVCLEDVNFYGYDVDCYIDGLYVDILNNTSVDIWYLYMSPQSSDSWEEDVLGEDVLLAGDEFTVDLVGYDECIWDFKAVFADEEEVELYEVNVCEENVTFYE